MNNNWNDRIKNFEVTPPENGWDKIASSLDDTFIDAKFPITLYNLEANPPANTWNKIQSALDKEVAPVIDIKEGKSSRSFIKYAVAACLIGLLSFAAVKFFNKNNVKADVAIENNSAPTKNSLPESKDSNSAGQPVQSQTERDESALEQSKHTYAKLDLHSHNAPGKISNRLYNSPALLAASASDLVLPKIPELQYPHRAAVNDLRDEQSTDRYLMFKDSEGRFVRMSKKLTDLLCCVSGEEQDHNCIDQLKKWREKIASSAFIPSPDNFMDILDLVTSLEDPRN